MPTNQSADNSLQFGNSRAKTARAKSRDLVEIKRPRDTETLHKSARVCHALRKFQWKTRASDKQLSETLELIKEIGDVLRCGTAELPANIREADTPLRHKVGHAVKAC